MSRRTATGLLLASILTLSSCETVGVAREEGGYAEVKPTIAHEMVLDSQQVVVFDLRPVEEYWGPLGHVAGALSVPLPAIETRLSELIPYKDTTILVYADSEEESRRGARILAAAGFENIVRIRGGIREWVDLGYPTVTPQ
ncbi:MAG TPA: rhodanese-like domain-containing protein [Thermoanaerobaculia bacterium]|nr:rhodanese-like domain-containing protein [Thermoanaerobaculia bacterium]